MSSLLRWQHKQLPGKCYQTVSVIAWWSNPTPQVNTITHRFEGTEAPCCRAPFHLFQPTNNCFILQLWPLSTIQGCLPWYLCHKVKSRAHCQIPHQQFHHGTALLLPRSLLITWQKYRIFLVKTPRWWEIWQLIAWSSSADSFFRNYFSNLNAWKYTWVSVCQAIHDF